MVADTQPKSLTDDFEHLFDLIKEGASYLLHIYLFFMSKTFSADSIEQILDHHRKTSSYDYSKEGKTYIFRLLSALFQVEKHIVAMNLQYMYNYIPFPFLKNISENFCITNNLKCTDLKKKTSKKVLIDNPDNETAVQNETKNSNEDDEPVSRPFPLAPPTPKSQTENTNAESVAPVSKKIPPSIDFGTSLQQTIEKNNKAFDKNMQNFGKSMTNVFEGTNTPTPGPSADE